jgi:hypothetical protein
MSFDPALDHLVFAVPDLAKGVAELERRLGVRATPGGKHVGLGTHNALLALSDTAYLEVIGPDPDQPAPAAARPFGIDRLAAGRLVTWARRSRDLDGDVARARAAGFDPGTPLAMSRARPDGVRLDWRLTLRAEPAGDGLVPFLIDWGATPSPALSCAKGASLRSLRAEHPDPEPVSRALAALGATLALARGPSPALVATLATPKGVVELR